METVDVNINIYKITSGKCGFFTFWETKSRRLDLPFEPFKIKPPHELYPYKYHMGEEQLMWWKKYNSKITPYSPGLTAQSWEDCMKYEMFRTIIENKLDRKVEHNGKILNITFKWIGDPVLAAKFEYK